MHGVHRLLRGWMEAAGMKTTVDAVGNLRGLYPSSCHPAPRIVLGSHLDTVPDAGAFDGVLGVVMAVAIVEELSDARPVSIEVVGFSEEEGVRFRKPFIGSLALVGGLDAATLALVDADGISLSGAIRDFGLDPARIPDAQLASDAVAYLEVHVEQGPVLEQAAAVRSAERLPPSSLETPREQRAAHSTHAPSVLGVVNAIAGQSRVVATFIGQANHAGTTPMHLRRDALAAAAEWIVAVETMGRQRPGLVATVGHIEARPGVSNVIAGKVHATLDVRHPDDAARKQAVADALVRAADAARARNVQFTHEVVLEQAAVPMSADLVRLLQAAVTRSGHVAHLMASGAGHDAMILAPYLPSAMLFVPSPGGLSHHPEEAALARDIEAALETALEFVRVLSHDKTLAHA